MLDQYMKNVEVGPGCYAREKWRTKRNEIVKMRTYVKGMRKIT